METKICTKCKRELPLTEEYFYIGNGGFRSMCKDCYRQYAREKYRNRNGSISKEKGRPVTAKASEKGTMKCRECGIELPYTNEYFTAHKSYKSGLSTRCKTCESDYQRERYSRRVGTKYITKEEKIKAEEKKCKEISKRLMNEKIEAGLDLSKIKLANGKKYKISIKKNWKKKYEPFFEGVMMQDCKTHVTFKHKLGYTESFLKADFLTGDYKVEEVKSFA
ncbi:hypothetical protein ACR77J_16495 [Tissierella praeacuta]|uniref:hypothetical protein n=1 Tax=Tissierella praeacuta TaxID=43131 RepID=UPI003DA20D4F